MQFTPEEQAKIDVANKTFIPGARVRVVKDSFIYGLGLPNSPLSSASTGDVYEVAQIKGTSSCLKFQGCGFKMIPIFYLGVVVRGSTCVNDQNVPYGTLSFNHVELIVEESSTPSSAVVTADDGQHACTCSRNQVLYYGCICGGK